MRLLHYIYYAIGRFLDWIRVGEGFGGWRSHTCMLLVMAWPAFGVAYAIFEDTGLVSHSILLSSLVVAPLFLLNEYFLADKKRQRSFKKEFDSYSASKRLLFDSGVVIGVCSAAVFPFTQ